jgi:hypothetical protein
MSNKAQNLVNKAKNSIKALQSRASQLQGKKMVFSNDNSLGKLIQIQAWEDCNLPFNQFCNGIHE